MTISAICLEHLFSHMLAYTLREDAVQKCIGRAGRAVCTPSMRSDNSLHAVSAPWLRSQSPVRTPWERRGTPWALLGNATVAVGVPWHLHVMENVKLFAILFSIFVRSHGALRNFKSPCQRRGIAAECDRGLRYACWCRILMVSLFSSCTVFFRKQLHGQANETPWHIEAETEWPPFCKWHF